MGFNELIKDVQATKEQIGPADTVIPVLKLFSATVTSMPQTLVGTKTNIGDAFTVGHSVNGIIGTANGEGGGQITIGVGDLGASSTDYVVSSNNNNFQEFLRDSTFINSANTTATTNTTTYLIDF